MEMQENSGIIYPSIVVKLRGGLYAVNSRDIATIVQLPEHEALPDPPPCISGIFPYRGEIVQMLDLRSVFGMQSLQQEFEDFAAMLEQRKQDHINWVMELERSTNAGEPFTLATDPHKCAFGKWYDHFHSDNNAVTFHLRKIDEPHRMLHQAADDVARCSRQCESCTRPECLQNILKRTKEEYMPLILRLLDEAKDIFKSTLYHEMVLLLSDNPQLGIVVDEVLAVEVLTPVGNLSGFSGLRGASCITGIMKSGKIPGEILDLDVPKLLESVAALA